MSYQTYSVLSVVKRINRKLIKMVPPHDLQWDYSRKNYFLHTLDESRSKVGPVYWEDLLAFCTYINGWKHRERDIPKYLMTPRGYQVPEMPLRSALKVHLVTALEHALVRRLAPGEPERFAPFEPMYGAATASALPEPTDAEIAEDEAYDMHEAELMVDAEMAKQ